MSDHPMQRATDQSSIAKLNAKVGEYKIFIWPLVVVALAMGFKYTTPSERITKIENVQMILKHAVDSLNKITASQAQDVKALSLLQCFNNTYSNGQLRLVGIDCTGIRP